MSKAIVFMADGMEMCECLLTVDLLRRAKVDVVTASVMGGREITSSHKVTMLADTVAEEADYDAADLIFLPGGRIGTENLASSEVVREQCLSFAGNGPEKKVAAICAAPSVLAGLGLLEGKKATCHPDFENKMEGAKLTGESVAVDDNIITGQGLGATFDFALELVRILADDKEAARIAKATCYMR